MKKKAQKKAETPRSNEGAMADVAAVYARLNELTEEERSELFAELDSAMDGMTSDHEVLTEFEAGPQRQRVAIERETLRQGTADGVDVVHLDNGVMKVSVLPTRGMGLWKIEHPDLPGPIGWSSPVSRPVHPSFVNLESRNGLGWLDGFNELLCRCGLSSNGPPGNDAGARSAIESALTLHGRIANTPAEEITPQTYLDGDADDPEGSDPAGIGVVGTVNECVLFGPQLRMRSQCITPVLSNTISIQDEIRNTGSTAAEVQLLYHINIGPPVLEEGATIHVPAAAMAPRDERAAEGIDDWSTCLGPTPGYTEQGYYFEPLANAEGDAVILLRSADGRRGLAMRFAVEELPRFVLWKCTQPESDGYVVGLEPATNFPNFKAYEREQGRVISLGPGESYFTNVMLMVLTTAEDVAAVQDEIEAIQAGKAPVVHRVPQPGWSPAGEGK